MDSIDVVPGSLPDGTRLAMFKIATANLGELQWMLSQRQALTVASQLEAFGTDDDDW